MLYCEPYFEKLLHLGISKQKTKNEKFRLFKAELQNCNITLVM